MGRAMQAGSTLGSFKDPEGNPCVCRESKRERRQMTLGRMGQGQGLQGLWGSLHSCLRGFRGLWKPLGREVTGSNFVL